MTYYPRKRPTKKTTPKKATKKVVKKTGRKRPRPPRERKDECFITTACVKYYNLNDDCYQLSTLRKFRDTHLKKTNKGNKLVIMYYEVAPILVDYLEHDSNKSYLFREIFAQINDACKAIDSNKTQEAIRIYAQVVFSLMKKYSIKNSWQ